MKLRKIFLFLKLAFELSQKSVVTKILQWSPALKAGSSPLQQAGVKLQQFKVIFPRLHPTHLPERTYQDVASSSSPFTMTSTPDISLVFLDFFCLFLKTHKLNDDPRWSLNASLYLLRPVWDINRRYGRHLHPQLIILRRCHIATPNRVSTLIKVKLAH